MTVNKDSTVIVSETGFDEVASFTQDIEKVALSTVWNEDELENEIGLLTGSNNWLLMYSID